MKRRGTRIAGLSVLAFVAAMLLSVLAAPAAQAANYWALRHDGPNPCAGGAWNNKFVAADGAGTKQLIANRTAIGEWEIFDYVLLGGQWIALKAKVNGKYVSWQNSPNMLIANGDTAGGADYYERYYVDTVGLSGGHFRLLTNDGRFVRLDSAGRLYADTQNQGLAAVFLQWAI